MIANGVIELGGEGAYPQIIFASDCSVLVRFGNSISKQIHEEVFKTFLLISEKRFESVRSIHPAYNSILITFNCVKDSPLKVLNEIKKLLSAASKPDSIEYRRIEIPVCYYEEFANDISFVAAHNNISVEEVIRIHSNADYLVYFLGFSPGFPYLGGMPKEISTPRLEKPRLIVPEGSVAIGGDQTGIYPSASPGGWRIIGRTPLKLFNPDSNEPVLLRMGDLVKFTPISKSEYEKMRKG